MKRGSTMFLRGVVILMGIAVLALCIYLASGVTDPRNAEYLPIVLGLYTAAIPFFGALYQTLKLLAYIDKDKAFSELSVRALSHIKHCAVAISVVFTFICPFLYGPAQDEDAPGLMAMGLVIVAASAVIAVFAAVCQRVLQSAVDIKSENDLTV